MKMDIINKSTEKRSSFHESRIVITQVDHTKLKGTIPCYNCSREFVTVNHGRLILIDRKNLFFRLISLCV
jgi:hypothetical protein